MRVGLRAGQMAVKMAAMRVWLIVVSWVDLMVGEMGDCWAGMTAAMRVRSVIVSSVDLMVGKMADCWAG